MFTGALPKPVVEQIARVVPFQDWREIYVGCSGSFRIERELKTRHNSIVHSNDVSLLTTAFGRLVTDEPMDISFIDRLAFIEGHVTCYADRVAAILVALSMAKYKGANEFAQRHFTHYQTNFATYLDKAKLRVTDFADTTTIDSFRAGDFRLQATLAAEHGGGVVAAPPTYKGGYEALYKFLDANTEWETPAYSVYDPASLPDWITEIQSMGIPYCILTDTLLEGHEPATVYRSTTHKPIFAFISDGGTSVRQASMTSEAFRYEILDPATLTKKSKVTVRHMTTPHMNFLKNQFLSRGIAHVSGMVNFAVFIDNKLAGGIIYNRATYGSQNTIYLLCDFSTVPGNRVSKLIALIATSKTLISEVEKRLVARITNVFTTAFTEKPVSMKYRGAFKIYSRKPGMINYTSEVRDDPPPKNLRRLVSKTRCPVLRSQSKTSPCAILRASPRMLGLWRSASSIFWSRTSRPISV